MISLDVLFGNLGIVGGNPDAKDQYSFYEGVMWNDGSTTYNQYQFFEKLGISRRDFFRQYAANEREFYRSISDLRIKDFRTFYLYAAEYLSYPDWILKTGFWNDGFNWLDGAVWID